jgi:metal-responsive CopG/Arc/MetJ family transcriptional regulator|tara:strand:- start:229 stop:399 length:171 start_codon:yes stop_codon:yes gene_type:complete
MRINYKRNTGKVMSKLTFLEDVNVLDKLERVSKRKMTSQSEVVRESLRNYLQNWDC